VSIIAMLGLRLIITYVAMRAAHTLLRLLGRLGADVIGRISGFLLAGVRCSSSLTAFAASFYKHLGPHECRFVKTDPNVLRIASTFFCLMLLTAPQP
jgi:hypothetical protein